MLGYLHDRRVTIGDIADALGIPLLHAAELVTDEDAEEFVGDVADEIDTEVPCGD